MTEKYRWIGKRSVHVHAPIGARKRVPSSSYKVSAASWVGGTRWTEDTAVDARSDVKCLRCGYHVCAQRPECRATMPALLQSLLCWTSTTGVGTGYLRELHEHASGALVWRDDDKLEQGWQWRGPMVPGVGAKSGAEPYLLEALAAAVRAASISDRLPPGWVSNGPFGYSHASGGRVYGVGTGWLALSRDGSSSYATRDDAMFAVIEALP